LSAQTAIGRELASGCTRDASRTGLGANSPRKKRCGPWFDKLTMWSKPLKSLHLILSLSKDAAWISAFFSSLLSAGTGARLSLMGRDCRGCRILQFLAKNRAYWGGNRPAMAKRVFDHAVAIAPEHV
jgi:hypothetical protein